MCKGLEDENVNEIKVGCYCLDGLYWNEFIFKCVDKDECGCVQGGKYYYEKNDSYFLDCLK